MTVAPASPPLPARGGRLVPAAAAAALAAGALWLADAHGWRQGALLLVGAGLGVALYHAAFGFASAYRAFLTEGRSAGVRAQMLLLGVLCAFSFPLLASDLPIGGFVFPAGVQLAVGAFLFGIGMQLAGGCGSGTLYTAGGGNTRMLVVLLFFVVGSTAGAAQLHLWAGLPALPPLDAVAALGPWPALGLHLALFAAIAAAGAAVERRRRGALEPVFRRADGAADPLRGPWPLAWGAVALALLGALTLVLAGRPWGITSAFALWGSKAAGALGLADPATWPYWDWQPDALAAPLSADVTTVMDLGLMLGAFAAAGLAGRFAPTWRIPARQLLAAVVGGLMLGYGARLGYGCNIGAFVGGVASGSLHGWAWIAAALPGVWLGARLRPLFALS
jgi:uncharacterized membrane protein YedE/YeeE